MSRNEVKPFFSKGSENGFEVGLERRSECTKTA